MQIPFLKNIQALAGPPVNKVVTTATGPAQASAERILRHVLGGIPEVLAMAVGQIDSGEALATFTTSRELNPQKVIGFNAEVIRQQRKAVRALQLPASERLEELLISLHTQLHLLRLLPDGRRFLYVVVNCRDTNLALAREVMRTCEP